MQKELFERLHPGDSIFNKISKTPFVVFENFAGGRKIEVFHFKTITRATLSKWVDANNQPIKSVEDLRYGDVVKHKHLGLCYIVGLVLEGKTRCSHMREVSSEDAAQWHFPKPKNSDCD